MSRRGDIARRDKEYMGIWRIVSMGMNQGELKRSIKEDPNLTEQEKGAKLSELRAPYQKMSDEELLSLVRDFVKENGREPMQKDVLYDRELKARFGPWTRMLEKAGTRPVSQRHLDKLERRREKRIRQKKLRKERREAELTQL